MRVLGHLHLHPGKVVPNFKVLSHEKIEGCRGLGAHLKITDQIQQQQQQKESLVTNDDSDLTCEMDEEQCLRRHLQRAAQCSVASSNNRLGYLRGGVGVQEKEDKGK